MPDTADVFDYYTLMPNLAVVSLAGSLPEHEVKVLDLVVCKPKIRQALEKVLRDFKPDLIGLSAMTFQFDTLVRVAKYLRLTHPTVKLVAGGYHATLMAEEITSSGEDLPLDFLIRGEGEATLKELVAELAKPLPNFPAASRFELQTRRCLGPQPSAALVGPVPVASAESGRPSDEQFLFFGQNHRCGGNFSGLPV